MTAHTYRSRILLSAAVLLAALAGTGCGDDTVSGDLGEPVSSKPFGSNLPDDFHLSAVTQIDDTIYFFGGKDDVSGEGTTRVMAYDLVKGVWSEKASMRVPRVSPGVVAAGKEIFVIGGQNRDIAARETWKYVERYDIVTDSWSTLRDVTLDDYDGTSSRYFTAGDGRIFTVSTRRVDNSLRLYESVDGESWKEHRAQLPALDEPTLVGGEGKVYILGRDGSGGSIIFVEFDIATGAFTKKSAPRYSERGYASSSFIRDGRIYKINSYEKSPRAMEIYEVATDTWTRIDIPIAYRFNAIYTPIFTDGERGEVYFVAPPHIRNGFFFDISSRTFYTR